MFAAGRLSPRRQPGLILAGAIAGVAAAFHTPLAGIVFGIEEMSRSFEARTSGIILGAVIAAGITSLSLQGDYTFFGTTRAVLGTSWDGWLAVPVLGMAGGLLGGRFSRVLVLFANGLPGPVGASLQRHPVAFAAGCGLVVAACGRRSGGTAFGTGYAQALVVLGLVAYFSGVVQAPITAFVIVTEMTNDHALVVPLMLASLIGFAASRLVCPEGVYHALAHRFVRAGLAD